MISFAASLSLQILCQSIPPNSTVNDTNLAFTCDIKTQQTPSSFDTGTAANPSKGKTLAQLPEGYIAHPDIKTAYKIYNESVSWKEARQRCLDDEAHLAVTDSYVKFENMMNPIPLINAIHVGINRMYDDTDWVSTTSGATLSNLPWAPGYPVGVYDCVLGGFNPRGLKNLACTSKAIFACELPINKN